MWRFAISIITIGLLTAGDGFMFAIGSPVAAQQYQFKTAAFVFRTQGCEESIKPDVSATAEGLVKGERQSLPLRVSPGSKSGIYAVFQSWPADGRWVVTLKGSCGDLHAGAIVPVGPKGFIRESAKFFPRTATDKEIAESLATLTSGGPK